MVLPSLLLECAEMPIFIVLCEHQPRFVQNGKRNDNLSHFAKHKLLKKTFCCNLQLDQNLVFYKLSFLNMKHWCWQETKNDKKKGFERQKRQETKKLKGLMEHTFVIWYLDVVHFMIQRQRNKTKKQRDRNHKAKESKKEDNKEGRNKEQERERERETEKERVQKGEGKS